MIQKMIGKRFSGHAGCDFPSFPILLGSYQSLSKNRRSIRRLSFLVSFAFFCG